MKNSHKGQPGVCTPLYEKVTVFGLGSLSVALEVYRGRVIISSCVERLSSLNVEGGRDFFHADT